MIVPSPGSTVTELIAGLAPPSVGRRRSSAARRRGRGLGGRLGRGGRRRLGGLVAAARREGQRRDDARAREELRPHSRTSRGRRPSRSHPTGARGSEARRRTPSYDPSRCTPSGRHRSGGTRPADATRRGGRAGALWVANGTRTTRRCAPTGSGARAWRPCGVDDLHGPAVIPRSWRLKRAPTRRSYQGQSPRVSEAACTPTKPPPRRMYDSKADRCVCILDRGAGGGEEDDDVVAAQ